jgi:hypothetical protein
LGGSNQNRISKICVEMNCRSQITFKKKWTTYGWFAWSRPPTDFGLVVRPTFGSHLEAERFVLYEYFKITEEMSSRWVAMDRKIEAEIYETLSHYLRERGQETSILIFKLEASGYLQQSWILRQPSKHSIRRTLQNLIIFHFLWNINCTFWVIL